MALERKLKTRASENYVLKPERYNKKKEKHNEFYQRLVLWL